MFLKGDKICLVTTKKLSYNWSFRTFYIYILPKRSACKRVPSILHLQGRLAWAIAAQRQTGLKYCRAAVWTCSGLVVYRYNFT